MLAIHTMRRDFTVSIYLHILPYALADILGSWRCRAMLVEKEKE